MVSSIERTNEVCVPRSKLAKILGDLSLDHELATSVVKLCVLSSNSRAYNTFTSSILPAQHACLGRWETDLAWFGHLGMYKCPAPLQVQVNQRPRARERNLLLHASPGMHPQFARCDHDFEIRNGEHKLKPIRRANYKSTQIKATKKSTISTI